jgi:DNA-directed RNA polymerase subunit E'/Rpb7
MSKMFMPIKFNTTIILTPNELNKNFESTILTKIKATLENSCSKHGYIKKDSIKIIKRTPGYIKESHFNGNIAYDLNCIAEICNPAQDSIVKCIVKAKNNLGLLAIGKYEDMAILEVIIPKISSGILSDVNIDNINIGDEINVIVCGKKFTLYDKMISIIGKIIKDKYDDDITVIEEVEDDSPSIDEEDEDGDGASYLDIEDDDNDIYEEEEDDDDIDNVRKIIIDEDIDKTKGGEFSMFENDEEEEDLEEELEDLDDEDLDDDLGDDVDDIDFTGGDDYD